MENYTILQDGRVLDNIEGYIIEKCECDNTHQQNYTVCRYCWAYGRRKLGDADVKIGNLGKICTCCESKFAPVVRILTLTDGNGVILDTVNFCNDCWYEREVFIENRCLSF